MLVSGNIITLTMQDQGLAARFVIEVWAKHVSEKQYVGVWCQVRWKNEGT